jgi:hypothetical protein
MDFNLDKHVSFFNTVMNKAEFKEKFASVFQNAARLGSGILSDFSDAKSHNKELIARVRSPSACSYTLSDSLILCRLSSAILLVLSGS